MQMNEWGISYCGFLFASRSKEGGRYMVTCHERIKWRIPEKISQHPVQMGRRRGRSKLCKMKKVIIRGACTNLNNLIFHYEKKEISI